MNATLSLPITRISAATATGGARSTATVVSANAGRRSVTIQNQAADDLYIKLGASGSTTDYHIRIQPGVLQPIDGYIGIITCASATTPSYTVAELEG
jgi:hypothetical protein